MTTLTSGGGGGEEAEEERAESEPRRCSMRAFWLCLMESMERTCSRAFGSSLARVKPMTTGEIGVEAFPVPLPLDTSEGETREVTRG